MKRFSPGSFSALAASTVVLVACHSANKDTTSNVDQDADAIGAEDAPTSGLDATLVEPNTDAATPPPDGACGGTTVLATAREANLLLVLDASGSMLQKPAGFPVTKWQAVATSLRDALGPTKDKLSLGLELYPHGTDACTVPTGAEAIQVPIGPGASTFDTIVTTVAGTSPAGATPTAKALAAAREYFTAGAGKELKGDRYVVLATDGGPNCNSAITCGPESCTTNIDGNCSSGNCCATSPITCLDGDRVIAELNALKLAGVKTFVVGIPGTEAYKPWLDQFAEAGGVVNPAGPDKYFSVSASGGVAGLTAVFSVITGSLITSCRIDLDRAAPDPNQINVYVDEVPVPQGGADGWDYDGTSSPPSILIKGRTCDAVTTKGARVITVAYGCPTIR